MTTSARSSKRFSATRPAPSLPTRVVREEHGVAAVEFAIILPVLVMMLMGIIDWGFFFFFSESIVNAAREGARAGVVVEDPDIDAVSTAQAAAANYLGGAGISAGSERNQAEAAAEISGTDLQVTVTMASFEGLSGFLAPPLIPSSITYMSTMRLENPPP